MVKPTMILPLALLTLYCLLGTLLGRCTALSIQTNRQASPGYRRSVSGAKTQRIPSTLFHHASPSNNNHHSETSLSSARGPRVAVFGNISHNIRFISSRRVGENHDIEMNNKYNNCEQKAASPHHLLHAFSVVASCRRLSFLILSVTLVTFVRSTILKIPKSDKKMFDECPWPFTLFHDPIKFVKTASTQMIFVWVLLCQMYSRFAKARAIIP